MCNAAKHSPTCTCGFGPPWPPRYSTVYSESWEEVVADRPRLMRRSLEQAGWDPNGIEEFVRRYAVAVDAETPQSAKLARLRELLGLRRRVVEEVVLETVNIPLFSFGAPAVTGARVQYTEKDGARRGGGWSARIEGIGIGRTQTVQVNRTHVAVAGAGTSKLIFAPVQLRITKVAIYDGDRLVGRGVDAEVPLEVLRDDPGLRVRGTLSLDPLACYGSLDSSGDYLELIHHDLAGDASSEVTRDIRSWESEISHDVSLSLAKVGIGLTLSAQVKRTRSLELALDLPAGHEYRAYVERGRLRWERPVPPSPTARRPRRNRSTPPSASGSGALRQRDSTESAA